MTKALGYLVYLKDDTVATNAFTTVCVTSIDGDGVIASSETLEPCLSDTVVLDFPADPKYNQITVEYKKIAGSSGISVDMEAAALNTTLSTIGVKIPTSTVIYATRTAYVISHTDVAKERNQDMKSQIVLAPQSAWTFSTTEPTT